MRTQRLARVGAHPDDADILGSGLAMRWRARGGEVLFVSMANGDCGHQTQARAELAARRRRETEAVAALLGVEYVVMGVSDCEVMPTLAQRWALLGCLRRFAPDLVVTHPPQDYHPDHRYTAQLVGDVSYLLRVPHCCPEVPALQKDTVQAFFHPVHQAVRLEGFAVAVETDAFWSRKLEVMACHASQMFEWLPWVTGADLSAVPPPDDPEGRLRYVDARRRLAAERIADLYRDCLAARYGPDLARTIRTAEAYVAAPYPTPLSAANAAELFRDL